MIIKDLKVDEHEFGSEDNKARYKNRDNANRDNDHNGCCYCIELVDVNKSSLRHEHWLDVEYVETR